MKTLYHISYRGFAAFCPFLNAMVLRSWRQVLIAILVVATLVKPTLADERQDIDSFLEVTGFGLALESISLSAEQAPAMIGLNTESYGSAWDSLATEVFDLEVLREMALTILQNTLSDAARMYASEFYASELGQKLVQAENSILDIIDPSAIQGAGERIVAQLVALGDERIDLYRRMARAIDSKGATVHAVQEIQFRFMMAAADSGLVELKLHPDELRAVLAESEAELASAMLRSSMATAAYTYQDFSVKDVKAYVEALESPLMMEVYELLNAVQFEVQANRFVELAYRLASLQPVEDL